MADRRQIIWDFVANTKSFDQGTRRAEKGLGKVQTSMGGVAKAAAPVGAFLAGGAIAKFGKDAFGAAVAAEEAASKFDAVFGSSEAAAGAVAEFADKAGVATHRTQDLFATLGNLTEAQGFSKDASIEFADKVSDLAGDLASFNNQDPEEVFRKLSLAMVTTERESLKPLGIAISENEVKQRALNLAMEDGRDEASKADRALASYEIAVEQAGSALGDLERTQDSTANTMRRINRQWDEFTVQIGTELVDALDDALPLLEDAIPLLGFVADGLGRGADNVTAFTDALGDTEEQGRDTGSALDRFTDVLGGASDLLSRAPFLVTPLQERFGRLRDTLGEVGESWDIANIAASDYVPLSDELQRALEDTTVDAQDQVVWVDSLQRAYREAGLSAEEAARRIANAIPPDVRVARRVEEIAARNLPEAVRRAEGIGMHSGGVVPGIGPRRVTLLGGERVVPRGGAGGGGPVFVLNFNGVVGDPDAVAREVVGLIDRYERVNGPRPSGLPFGG